MTVANFLALWANLAVLAGAGLAASRLFRLRGTKAWLPYLQILLASCVLLPILIPERKMPPTTVLPAVPALPYAVVSGPTPSASAFPDLPKPRWSAERVLYAVIAAGIAGRTLWLLIGFARLQYYRRRSQLVAECPEALRDALVATGAPAEFRISRHLQGPVTFGFLRPVVLLPLAFSRAGAAEQRAVATHEALHVSRLDWLASLLEEAVATLLWFQPAVSLVLSEIRLAREQAVDRASIALTQDRDSYLAALFSASQVAMPPDCALARPFLRRRHLYQRIECLLKGDSMSARQLTCSYAAAVVLTCVATAAIGSAVPLQSPAQTVVANPSVTVTPGGAVAHRSAIDYPDEARRARIEGTVLVEVTPPANGNPATARATSGPDMLREAAELSALKYVYRSPGLGGGTVAIDFRLPPLAHVGEGKRITGIRSTGSLAAPGSATNDARLQQFVGQILTIDKWNEILDAAPNLALRIDVQDPQSGQAGWLNTGPVSLLSTGPLQHVTVANLIPDQTATVLIQRLQRYVGRRMDAQLMGDIYRDVYAVSPEFRVVFSSALVSISTPSNHTSTAVRPQQPQGAEPPKVIRVGGTVQAFKLTSGPPPVYPNDARAARVQGTVRFSATIDESGAISQLTLESGHPMLVNAAMEAVRQWRYQPTLLNGQPVKVQTTIEVNFKPE